MCQSIFPILHEMKFTVTLNGQDITLTKVPHWLLTVCHTVIMRVRSACQEGELF